MLLRALTQAQPPSLISYSCSIVPAIFAQDGGREEQADQQGQEGRKEEDVSHHHHDSSLFNSDFITHLCLTLVVPVCSVDPFAKKDWYDVKAPSTFSHRGIGKTLVTRTQGTKVGSASQTSLQCEGSIL